MFWGCVSLKGEEASIPLLGTINSVKYIDIFKNYLIPSLTWYFGNHTEIFQQDNASWHALWIVMEYLDKNDIFTLYWPPQSPDLNIIGNIWHMITRKLHKNTKFFKCEQNIIGCFLTWWNVITQKELDHLNSSISTRCKDVLYMKAICINISFIVHCLMNIMKQVLTSYLSISLKYNHLKI